MKKNELREYRCNLPISIDRSSNSVAIFAQSPMIMKYRLKNKNADIHKQAVNGLISFGNKNNFQQQSIKLSDILRKSIQSNDPKAIGECAIHLFTLQTFLNKSVNKYLRNALFQNSGSSKIITQCYQAAYDLLPFCILLNNHIRETKRSQFKGTVYRGCNLKQDQVKEYIQNIGQHRQWNGFTSTSKNRKFAQSFGNVLLVIQLGQQSSSQGLHYGLEIENFSAFKSQEEVLLFAGVQILIQAVEKANGKHVITIVCTDLGG